MAKDQKSEQKPRTYSMTFEDGETVTKTVDELSGEQVYACEKLNALNTEIGRLNAALADSMILRDHYQVIAGAAFKDEDSGDSEGE